MRIGLREEGVGELPAFGGALDCLEDILDARDVLRGAGLVETVDELGSNQHLDVAPVRTGVGVQL